MAGKIEQLLALLKEKKALHWSPQPFETSFELLKAAFEDWESGELELEEYLFGLFENNADFFAEFVRDLHKAKRLSSNLMEDTLMDWLSKLRELKLHLDVVGQLEGLVFVRSCLRSALSIIQKAEPTSKAANLLTRILEEMSAWNKKHLTLEELGQLKRVLAQVKEQEHLLDSKDYDWVQFQHKIAGYAWRQEAKLMMGMEDLPHCDIEEFLKRTPKDLKAAKIFEFTALLERLGSVEWMDDKQIVERILEILNGDIDEHNKEAILKFLNDADICAVGDEALQKKRAIEKVVLAKCSSSVQRVEDLEDLVKTMLESKFWNTKTFAYFDQIHRVIQSVSLNAKLSQNIRHKVETAAANEKVTMELVKRTEKPLVEDIEQLLRDFKDLSDSLTINSREDFSVIDQEVKQFTQFLDSSKPVLMSYLGRIANVISGEALKACSREFETIIETYFHFTVRNEAVEDSLCTLEVMIKACKLLDTASTEVKKDIGTWDIVLNEVKRLYKKLAQEPKIISELEAPLAEAKEFIKRVHLIKHGTDRDNNLVTVEELKELLLSKVNSPGKICLQDCLEYLDSTIRKAESIRALMSQPKVTLSDLTESLVFMENTCLQFDGKQEACLNRINAAKDFKEKFNQLCQSETLEKNFDQFTEEYRRLDIEIPEIEEKFNQIQDCKNLRRDADSLMNREDCQIPEILEMKARVVKMKYYKSSNLLARIFCKLFYKMRETYENSSDKGFRISYEDLNRLIREAQDFFSKKLKDDIKIEFKEKFGFIKEIAKDVNEYLNKYFDSLSLKQLKESPSEEVFRGFVNISGPITEHRRKLEEKDQQPKPSEAKKEDPQKPQPKDQVSQQLRNHFMQTWSDLVVSNKSFSMEQKEAIHVSKVIEKEVHMKFETKQAEYEKNCEEISRIFREVLNYSFLSAHIKASKFSLKCLRDFFGKPSVDIRALNYSLSKVGGQKLPLALGQTLQQPSVFKDAREKTKTDQSMEEEETASQQFVIGEYKYYRTFIGDFVLEHKEPLRLEKVQLFTCSKATLVNEFSYIPQNLKLECLQRKTANDYISKAIAKLNQKYKVLPGYVSNFVQQDKMKKLLLEGEMFAYKPYSQSTKLLVFPKEFLLKEWCDDLEIVLMNREVELLCFLIYRMPEAGKQEGGPKVIPDSMPISGCKPIRLINYNGKLKEHSLNLDHLKEKVAKLNPKKEPEEPAFASQAQAGKGKAYLDNMKFAEVGPMKSLNAYCSNISDVLNSNAGVAGFSHPKTHQRSHHQHLHQTFGYPRGKPANLKPDRLSQDNSLERMDSSFDATDLLGTLQNKKPNKPYPKPFPKPFLPHMPASYPDPGQLQLNPILAASHNSLLAKRPPALNSLASLNGAGLSIASQASKRLSDPVVFPVDKPEVCSLTSAISIIQNTGASGSLGSAISHGSLFDKSQKKTAFPSNYGDQHFKKKTNGYGSSMSHGLSFEYPKNHFS